MGVLDVFNSDPFGVIDLTASINKPTEGQKVPGAVDDLFDAEGVTTPNVMIEREGEGLTLIPAKERGAPGEPTSSDKRDAIPFVTTHLPTPGFIGADEILGVRSFGSESEVETIQNVVNKRLMKMRSRLQATIAFQRIGAIKGQILDSDGSTVLLDLFTAFGMTQQTKAMALTTATTKVKTKLLEAKELAEDAIGSSSVITGWRCVAGRTFFNELVGHSKVESAFDRWQDGSFLRADNRVGFSFCDIDFISYYGSVGGIGFIGADDAYLIPIVEDLFITRFAPANYVETVNTLGLPFYAKQELSAMGKGVNLESQSNVLNLCTNPRAVIKLTKI